MFDKVLEFRISLFAFIWYRRSRFTDSINVPRTTNSGSISPFFRRRAPWAPICSGEWRLLPFGDACLIVCPWVSWSDLCLVSLLDLLPPNVLYLARIHVFSRIHMLSEYPFRCFSGIACTVWRSLLSFLYGFLGYWSPWWTVLSVTVVFLLVLEAVMSWCRPVRGTMPSVVCVYFMYQFS